MKTYAPRHVSIWICPRRTFVQYAECPYPHVSHENLSTTPCVIMHKSHMKILIERQMSLPTLVRWYFVPCTTCQFREVSDEIFLNVPPVNGNRWKMKSHVVWFHVSRLAHARWKVSASHVSIGTSVIWDFVQNRYLSICTRVRWKYEHYAARQYGHV